MNDKPTLFPSVMCLSTKSHSVLTQFIDAGDDAPSAHRCPRCLRTSHPKAQKPKKKHPHFLPIRCFSHTGLFRQAAIPHMSPKSGEESLSDRRAFSSAIMCIPNKAHAFTVPAEMQGPNSIDSLRTIGSFFLCEEEEELAKRPVLLWHVPFHGSRAQTHSIHRIQDEITLLHRKFHRKTNRDNQQPMCVKGYRPTRKDSNSASKCCQDIHFSNAANSIGAIDSLHTFHRDFLCL